MKPLSTLFRNRDGGLCAVCCCLVFLVFVTVGVWAGLCVWKATLFDFPARIVEAIAAVGAVKGWQNHVGEYYGTQEKCDPPAPAPPVA